MTISADDKDLLDQAEKIRLQEVVDTHGVDQLRMVLGLLIERFRETVKATRSTPDENDREVLAAALFDAWEEDKSLPFNDVYPWVRSTYLAEADAVIAAGFSRVAVPDTTEPEWEYGVLQGGGGHYVHTRGEQAKAKSAINADRGDVLVYRTKANFVPVGRWLPVPERGEG